MNTVPSYFRELAASHWASSDTELQLCYAELGVLATAGTVSSGPDLDSGRGEVAETAPVRELCVLSDSSYSLNFYQ